MPRRQGGKRPTAKTVLETVRRQGVLQLDSVNVLARAHQMPVFSRLGPYDAEVLERLTFEDKQLFEAWSHAASLVPIELWPHHEARRQRFRRDWAQYVPPERLVYVKSVLAELTERGPLAAGELSDAGARRAGKWFERSSGKQALEYLFGVGEVAVAARRGFERVYDLTERVIPADVLRASPMDEIDARRELVLRATTALGVATIDDIADYYRLKITPTRAAVRELVASGEVIEVSVDTWSLPAYGRAGLRVPRALAGHALLNPFDPIVWRRPRVSRLFGFDYTIEIYVPEPKRVYGYYVLPFLLDDRLVARVDLKADRQARVLRVLSASHESHARVAEIAPALAAELWLVADWLALTSVDVASKGTSIAKALRREVLTTGPLR